MSGYKRDIVMRIVPVNGAETVYWFTDNLTDLGMHTRCAVNYPRTMQMREDINRVLRPVIHAKRAQVQIDVTIASMADHWFLQEIEEALDDPANYSVFLSLDGGVVEREVVWLNASGLAPSPISGRTIVGATFTLALQTKAPIAPRGPMMTDPGIGAELIQDGGFEQWPTGTTLQSWISAGVVSIAKETTIVKSGLASCKATRSDGSSFGAVTPASTDIFKPLPGCWYRIRISARSSVNLSVVSGGPARVQVYNQTKHQIMNIDGKTVGADIGESFAYVPLLSASWTDLESYFRVPNTWRVEDQITGRLSGYWTSGESVYYDDFSVYGPVLRPGYATW